MSKVSDSQSNAEILDEEMLEEYDFSQGVRGKFGKFDRTKQRVMPSGIQFVTDIQGRKTAVFVNLQEWARLWRKVVEQYPDLENLHFLVSDRGEKIAVLLEFDRHLAIWQQLYDEMISQMPGYESSVICDE
jgi:hypothetical protein